MALATFLKIYLMKTSVYF